MGDPILLSARDGGGSEEVAPYTPEALQGASVVFLCTPHGVSQPLVREALAQGCRVVDLSADFRLRDPGIYAQVYGSQHTAPDLLAQAVYGLTEHARTRLPGARLVANPGCYPTSVLLPLTPLARAGLVDTRVPVVCDCKSGVSGAGNTPSSSTLFGAVHENFRAYAVGGHRHAPEIRQESGLEDVVFVPHLLPVFRGILSTVYLKPAPGATVDGMREHLRACWEDEPFVHLLEEADGQPQLSDVRMTNRCLVALTDQGGHVVVTSVIDNLTKGASGQAIQNMNLMLGFPETAGLA
jgi:N-acetyl-gamma-glutamyl-phosphate reductase